MRGEPSYNSTATLPTQRTELSAKKHSSGEPSLSDASIVRPKRRAPGPLSWPRTPNRRMRNALEPVSKSFAELWAFAAAASILLISTLARSEAQPPPEVSLVIAAEPRAADDLELVIRE